MIPEFTLQNKQRMQLIVVDLGCSLINHHNFDLEETITELC